MVDFIIWQLFFPFVTYEYVHIILVYPTIHTQTHTRVCEHKSPNSMCNNMMTVSSSIFLPYFGCRHRVNRKVKLTNSNSISYYGCLFMNEIRFTMARASLYDNLWEETIDFHHCMLTMFAPDKNRYDQASLNKSIKFHKNVNKCG